MSKFILFIGVFIVAPFMIISGMSSIHPGLGRIALGLFLILLCLLQAEEDMREEEGGKGE